jgi:periplasmic protein TonB
MFERFANGKRRDWKRRALLIGSLGLHGAVVVGLLIGSWFRVDELTPPLLAVVFVPPAAPAQQPAAETPKSRPHAAAHRAQPSALHQPAEAPPATSDPGDHDPSDAPPAPPGEPGPPGPPGLPGAPCSGANCISAPAPKPRNLPPHALDAERLAGAMPHLPAAVIGARRGLGESTFTARLCLDTSGSVSSVTVLSGIPGADADIVATLRAWRYKPQPIPVCFVTQLTYDIQ